MNPKPQSLVYVAYVIPNPTEATTFFPQAVVKNTQTGVVVATVNLAQDANNSRRYTGSFMSPADSTGLGYYLDVITIPYTDAGHTTPSQNYWAATNQYFVSQSINGGANYGGGYMDFGPEMRKLLREELKGIKFPQQKEFKIPEFPKFPEAQKINLEPISGNIASLFDEIKSFRQFVESMPTYKDTNLGPVSGSIGVAKGDIMRKVDARSDTLESKLESLPASVREEIKSSFASIVRIFEEKFSAMIEKGIPVRSPVFQEEKPRIKSPGISDIMRALPTKRT